MDPEELQATEQAYFDSRGDSPLVEAAPEPVAEPAAEPAVESSAEPAAEPAAPEPPKMVDLRALTEARAQRDEIKRQLQEREKEFATLQGRLGALEQVYKKPEPPAPDFDDDPIGVLKQHTETQEQRIRQLEAERIANQQQQELLTTITNIQQRALADGAAFKQKTPDFQDAYDFIRDSLDRELQYQGVTDPQVRNQHMLQYELNVADIALKEGVNVAERVYEFAKMRGYTPKKAADPAEKLGNLAAGQAASKSLGASAGKGSSAGIDLKTLATMSDAEFAKYADDPAAWKKALTQ